MAAPQPWQGAVVALPTLFHADLSLDLDRLQEHVRWLAAEGVDGVSPCSGLSEVQSLSDTERIDLVRAVVQAAPDGCSVVPGVGGYGSRESRRWTQEAQKAGADAVLVPPPDGYAARDAEVVAHYQEVAAVGLPVVAYHDPVNARVDLTPELLARVAETDGVMAVQEGGGDVRRMHHIHDLIPHLDVVVGSDDILLELMMSGARGWMAALPNSLPALSVELYRLCAARDPAGALPLYTRLHPVLGWSRTAGGVQAVKLEMELAGRYGGPCRPPRGRLTADEQQELRRHVVRALRT
jgi:dihydrodipicolinate synthase/N-acetylneuraminate lyase